MSKIMNIFELTTKEDIKKIMRDNPTMNVHEFLDGSICVIIKRHTDPFSMICKLGLPISKDKFSMSIGSKTK